jgi:hypothetical protein
MGNGENNVHGTPTRAIKRFNIVCTVHCPHDPAFEETFPLRLDSYSKFECGDFAAPLENEKRSRKEMAPEDVADLKPTPRASASVSELSGLTGLTQQGFEQNELASSPPYRW